MLNHENNYIMMKRITFSLLVVLTFSTLSFGQLKFGAGASLQDFDAFGIQGKVLLDLEEKVGQPIDGVGTFTFYLGDILDWSIDIDGQYRLLIIGEDIKFSVLSGLQLARASTDFVSATDVGLNLGGNFIIPIQSFNIYAQPKVTIGGFSGITISGGILF